MSEGVRAAAPGVCGSCGHLLIYHEPGCSWQGCNCARALVSLTAQEFEILKLMARGKTSRQISRALGIASKTCEAHKSNMYRKTQAHNGITLVLAAVRAGVVPLASLPDFKLGVYVDSRISSAGK